MAHAALVFGEGATMMSEAAVLGVPSVYVNPLTAGTLEEQEREYGILFGFRPADFEAAVVKAETILAAPDPERWRAIGRRIAAEKVDVTELLYRVATERPYSRFAPNSPSQRKRV